AIFRCRQRRVPAAVVISAPWSGRDQRLHALRRQDDDGQSAPDQRLHWLGRDCHNFNTAEQGSRKTSPHTAASWSLLFPFMATKARRDRRDQEGDVSMRAQSVWRPVGLGHGAEIERLHLKLKLVADLYPPDSESGPSNRKSGAKTRQVSCTRSFGT